MRRIVLCLLFFIFFLPYALKAETWVVSSYPLYKIFKEIFPQKELHLLQPPKGEFHFFEPTSRDWEKIKRAEVVAIVGTEPFAKRIYQLAPEERIFSLKEKSERVFDPHLWWDLERLEGRLKAFLNRDLLKRDSNYAIYKERGEAFLKELSLIRQNLRKLSECKQKEIYILGHAVFYYLFKDTGIKENPLISGHHHGEVSPQKLVNFLKTAKAKGIKGILLTDREFLKYKALFEKEGLMVKEVWSGDREVEGSFIELLKKNLQVFKEVLNCQF